MASRYTGWLAALMSLFARNWITLFGASISGVSALLIIGFLILGMMQASLSPYLGIMALLMLPGVFVAGLFIIPVGAWVEQRRAWRNYVDGASQDPAPPFPVIDFNQNRTRRIAGLVMVLTVFNLLIISTVTYKGVHFMDSVTFCGRVCHTVMEPEYTAYTNSPHSRVECVECHIGPGAPWFVRSKLSGLGQVFAVMFNSYEKPIPVPVENLRPSRDTCEQCHWPERFTGDRVRVITKFQDDEENTEMKTVLLMHIGGGDSERGGIHSWHVDPDKRTTYVTTSPDRNTITQVRVEKSDGTVMLFRDPDAAAGEEEDSDYREERLMDCIDCHNRPTHIMRLPEQAVNEAMEHNRIDRSLPYIRKVAVEALTEISGDQPDRPAAVADSVYAFYEQKYPDIYRDRRADLDGAVAELQKIYSQNVFPEMDVDWGTYASNIGHESAPGCYRCHNNVLETEDGTVISDDCTICHTVLAWDEENPEILEELGLDQGG